MSVMNKVRIYDDRSSDLGYEMRAVLQGAEWSQACIDRRWILLRNGTQIFFVPRSRASELVRGMADDTVIDYMGEQMSYLQALARGLI